MSSRSRGVFRYFVLNTPELRVVCFPIATLHADLNMWRYVVRINLRYTIAKDVSLP